MTSRGQCPREGGGGVLANVFTPPPSGNPVSAPAYSSVSLCYRHISSFPVIQTVHGISI